MVSAGFTAVGSGAVCDVVVVLGGARASFAGATVVGLGAVVDAVCVVSIVVGTLSVAFSCGSLLSCPFTGGGGGAVVVVVVMPAFPSAFPDPFPNIDLLSLPVSMPGVRALPPSTFPDAFPNIDLLSLPVSILGLRALPIKGAIGLENKSFLLVTFACIPLPAAGG